MNKLSMCRICMIKNVRLHNIINTNLQNIYEKLTALTFETTDSRPLQVCYICHAKLNNCDVLRDRCIKSDRLFIQMLKNNDLELTVTPSNTIGRTERLVLWSSAPGEHTLSDDEGEQVTEVHIKIEEDDDANQVLHPYAPSKDNLDISNVITIDEQQTESNLSLDNLELNMDHPITVGTLTDLSLDISEVNAIRQNKVDEESNSTLDTSEGTADIPLLDTSEVDVIKPNYVVKEKESTYQHNMDRQSLDEIDLANLNNPELNIDLDEIDRTDVNSPEMNIDNNLEAHIGAMEQITDTLHEVGDNMVIDELATKLRDNMCSRTVKVVLHRMNLDKSNVFNEMGHDPVQDHSYSKITNSSLDPIYPSISSVSSAVEESPTHNAITTSLQNLNSGSVSENEKPPSVEESREEIQKQREDQRNMDINKKGKRTHVRHKVTTDKNIKERSSKKRFKKHINELLKEFCVNKSFEKPFRCSICAKLFVRKDTFLNHIRTHTGEKPYRCRICSKSFSRTDTLTSHIRIHTGERPYKCDVCESSFIQKCDLSRHSRLHNGEKPYKCDICGRCFSEKGNLTKHVRVHTGENPYKCEKCGRGFNQKSTLNRHTRIHTGVKY